MLKLPDQIQIKNLLNGEMCDARIVKLTRDLAQTHVDGVWWNIGGSKQVRSEEDDHSWKWAKVVGEHRANSFVQVAGVQTIEGTIEGAICYRLDGKSLMEPTSKAVYVVGLASAPHNRSWLCNSPHYRGVGDALLFRAVCHSWLLGFKGRAVLVSFSSPRTVNFYEKRRLRRVSTNDDGTIEFELEPEIAKQWLRSRGVLT